MINNWMVRTFGPSWKTSFFGVVAFLSGMVVAIPAIGNHWPMLAEIAKYIMGASVGGGLLVAKDRDVTGGTKLAMDAVPDAQLHKEAAKAAKDDAK